VFFQNISTTEKENDFFLKLNLLKGNDEATFLPFNQILTHCIKTHSENDFLLRSWGIKMHYQYRFQRGVNLEGFSAWKRVTLTHFFLMSVLLYIYWSTTILRFQQSTSLT